MSQIKTCSRCGGNIVAPAAAGRMSDELERTKEVLLLQRYAAILVDGPVEIRSLTNAGSEPIGIRSAYRLAQRLHEMGFEIRMHRCALPASITEALNSGDGTYRP
jgi:hypothetical protein